MIAALTVAMSASPAFAHPPKDGVCPAPPDPPGDKIGVCHRTGSLSNPFVQITPNCNAIGHDPANHDPTGQNTLSDEVNGAFC
jgi:hypothetical protein